jgi:hypothetical protein
MWLQMLPALKRSCPSAPVAAAVSGEISLYLPRCYSRATECSGVFMTAYSTTFTPPSNVANTPTAAGASCDKLCDGDVGVSRGNQCKNNTCTHGASDQGTSTPRYLHAAQSSGTLSRHMMLQKQQTRRSLPDHNTKHWCDGNKGPRRGRGTHLDEAIVD